MTQMDKFMNSPARRPLATRSPRATRKAAFTLIEVTLALGVTAFCLLAIFGLLPIGLRSNRAAIAQTTANGILSAVAADLRATGPSTTGTTSAQFGIPIPSNPTTGTGAPWYIYFGSDGSSSAPASASPPASASMPDGSPATHRLTVTFPSNPSAPLRAATYANLMVSWPAVSGTANAEGYVTMFVALDRN